MCQLSDWIRILSSDATGHRRCRCPTPGGQVNGRAALVGAVTPRSLSPNLATVAGLFQLTGDTYLLPDSQRFRFDELAARDSDAANEVLKSGVLSQRVESGIHPDPRHSS